MRKSDRDKHNERMRKIEQKKNKSRSSVSFTPLSSELLEDPHSEESSGQKLRIVFLSGVPKKEDIDSVASVLAELGKPPEWANSAHWSNGKARHEVYQGYFKAEANKIAQDLTFAGAKLVRC